MSDLPEEQTPASPPAPQGCYRLCEACGMFVPSEADLCPECGAVLGEEEPPQANPAYNLALTVVVALILLAALFVLAGGREAAREQERSRFARLGVANTTNVALVPTPTPLPPPTPTPVPPRPTATPLPPKPTAIPFTPDMFGATPTPRPTPVPPPTPTPRSRTLELKDQLSLEFKQKLDEQLPLAKVEDFVRLTLTDNRTVSGTIKGMGPQQLLLATSDGQIWIVYRQLIPESRLRVDANERATWVEERALQEVLRRLQNP